MISFLKITIIYTVLDMNTTMQFNLTIGSTLGGSEVSTTSSEMECNGKIISRGYRVITWFTDAHTPLFNPHGSDAWSENRLNQQVK